MTEIGSVEPSDNLAIAKRPARRIEPLDELLIVGGDEDGKEVVTPDEGRVMRPSS